MADKNNAALIVGVNYYEKANELFGCANDATSVSKLLSTDLDTGKKNFDIKLITATDPKTAITRRRLRDEVINLFTRKYDIALFYFAGHGFIESKGGYLMSSECKYGDDGLSTKDLMDWANDSPSTNKIIILDCCHSGVTGNKSRTNAEATLNNGVTILAASGTEQYSMESGGSGVFTTLLLDGLEGGAANLLGDITPGSIYAHIDQSLGAFEQRPIFKTHVESFISLRTVKPAIEIADLKRITELFPDKDKEFELDPSYEPRRDFPCDIPPIEENTQKFAILQQYNRLHLLVPNAKHMFDAAIYSKSCKLTPLGKHYWKLVKKKRI